MVGDEPEAALHDVRCVEVDGERSAEAECHGDAEWGGDEDGDNVDASENAVECEVATAKAAGEVQWADEKCGESAEDVRDREVAEIVEVSLLGGEAEHEDFGEGEDGEGHEAHDYPKCGLEPGGRGGGHGSWIEYMKAVGGEMSGVCQTL